ncbi:MAG: formate dehydrogenase accessory sulfurtransferase FdhD [Paracoccaceae bacterium]
MQTHRAIGRLAFRAGRWERGNRAVPEEVPVALVYNGTTQAVMMATPAALDDFGLGFSLTEGIVADRSDIRETEIVELPQGIEIRMWLAPEAEARFQARRRAQVGPVGCGLCGIDSIAEAMRALPPVSGAARLTPADCEAAMKGLMRHQALNDTTRAAHAAGFYIPGQGVILAREDVGRHNALDKLAGAMARAGLRAADGALVITSRVSVDMVQKAAMIGAPVLMAASAPTALAIDQADAAGLTLIAVLRGSEFELFTHPERFDGNEAADVA